MQIPDAPIPLTRAGPVTDDLRMAGLSASVDPFLGAPAIHAAACADAACLKADRRAAATLQHAALTSAPISAPILAPPDADSTVRRAATASNAEL